MNSSTSIQVPKMSVSVWAVTEWLENELTSMQLAEFVIEIMCHNDDVVNEVKKWLAETQK